MQQVMGFSVHLKGESLSFQHTIQLPVCWPWMARGSTAHRHSNGCTGLDGCPEAVEGGLVRDAKSQHPEMLLLSLPWALPHTAAQVPTRISPLPQVNAGVALGIALPSASHSPAELWGRAGRDSSACDELLGYLGAPAAIENLYHILYTPQTPPSPFMTLCCAPALYLTFSWLLYHNIPYLSLDYF